MSVGLPAVIALLIRHGLTATGFVGVLTGTQIEQVAGVAALAAGLGWSYWQKKGKK